MSENCSPIDWILGFIEYRWDWIRYHRWLPNCRKLRRKLKELKRRDAARH